MRTTYLRTRLFILIFPTLLLGACLTDDSVDSNQNGPAISFTNPANTSVIQTPDIVVNITGKVASPEGIDTVTWQNDRGGKGTANGTDNFATGNIVLQLGTNNITVTATDKSGTSSSKTLTVERENTAPSAGGQDSPDPVLMYSYYADLRNAAPVANASIRAQTVYFYVLPGTNWTSNGIDSILIRCCRGTAGPGEGDGYSMVTEVTRSPWSDAFDLSAMDVGGTRRARVIATYTDGTESSGEVFDFTIVDALGGTGNTAPMISGTPESVATAGVQYSFRPTAEDPDGDTMQFSISGKPSWASFNNTTGRLYGTPTTNDVGQYDNIVISVSDGQTSSSLRAFSITVEAFGNGSATLTWNVPTQRTDNSTLTNLAGYYIYYGQTSHDYANKIRVTNPSITSFVVDNLSSGPWYFVVTAYDAGGLESNPSNEGSKSF